MITKSLDVMMTRAGIYVVMAPMAFCFVEVDAAGSVFQLKPDTFERDGELIHGRWVVSNIRAIFGPLARVPETA